MAECPSTKCPPVFDDPRVAIKGTAFLDVEQDCKPEEGILLLTDESGLLNLDDPSLGDFLTLDQPTQTISSIQDAALHFEICSPLYRELVCLFAQSTRPRNVIIGHVEDGETLIEAFDRITACPICALTVQTAVYREDGSLFVDNADYFNFTNYINAVDDWTIHAITGQASTAFSDMFETGSWAAQAAAAGQDQTWNVMDVACGFEYDANCEVALDIDGNAIQVPYYLNSGLTAAAFHASYSTTDANYNYSVNSEQSNACHTGRFLDETTGTPGDLSTYDDFDLGALGQSGLFNLTGLTDGIGAPIIGASRHLSAFTRISNGKDQTIRYLSSIYVNGDNYADVFYKETAINNSVQCAILDFKDQFGTTLTEQGQRAEALVIQNVLNSWVQRGVINGDPYDWSSYANIIINGIRGNGEGYYIGATPFAQLDTSAINARAASFIQYCFIVNSPQHGSCVQVCKVPPISI